MFHIGTLIHKKYKVCDPDPFIYRQISGTDESHFLFYPLACQKNDKKKLTVPFDLHSTREKKVEQARIVVVPRSFKFHFGTKNDNNVP
ncbi:hypothetical protein OGY83_19105 [Citrobacter sp. Cpo090]|uniref:hypothetical protein n=1 Tax=Citrobacter sp. Cpo090 TaxID=2985139 RepID=UPI0025758825|nr:hypothetical protein [Citrobacter sp. Cpo090]MDM2845724.1 hypothetical protein [Citrobacter sp. Cpo090]